MIAIAPCKCGYTPYIDNGYYRSGKLYYFCKCPNCKNKGRDGSTEQQAIKHWNNGLQRRTA